jgi:hypothetical protein
MEGLKNSVEQQEERSWEQLKADSEAEAKKLISGILGYEDMTSAEKISALHFLLHDLAHDNANRFVCEVISKELSKQTELSRHSARMSELGQAD